MEWPLHTIGDFVATREFVLQTGPFGTQLHAHDYLESGIAVIPTEGIRDKKIDHSILPKISSRKALELQRHSLLVGDILFARRGIQATGRTAIITEDESGFICGTGAIRLRIISKDCAVDANYLAHLLSNETSVAWLKFHAIGATMPNLNEGIIRSFPFRLPPKPQQIAIAELLSSLDDKIELNRRMNETLEASARALFRDWFVDFGPTRAKAKGRPAYLDPSTWSLFPDDFNDDGSPKGWGYLPLQDITIELRRGISPKYVQYDGVRVLNQKCIRGRSVNFELARRHDMASKSISGRFLEVGDILINSTGVGTLGRTGQVWALDEGTIVDSHVTVVRADPTQISSVILGFDLNGRESEIEALGQGSTGQTELSRIQLGQLLVLVADKNIQERFDFAVKPSLEAISSNVTEYRALAETRDTLLPKLMSGAIGVRDAESAVAALC